MKYAIHHAIFGYLVELDPVGKDLSWSPLKREAWIFESKADVRLALRWIIDGRVSVRGVLKFGSRVMTFELTGGKDV